MGIFDLFFSIIFGIFFLLSIGAIIYGIWILFRPSSVKNQPPVIEYAAVRLFGIVLMAMGSELFIDASGNLFKVEWPDTQGLIGASTVLLFFSILGVLTAVGRPFLASNLIPESLSSRVFSGIFFVTFGILAFFWLSEDYWPIPDNIEDLIVFAILFSVIFTPVFLSHIRKQAN